MGLAVHIKCVHTKVKDKMCTLCAYASSYKSNLTLHVNHVHLKMPRRKPHACHHCDFRADRKWKLCKHILEQHGKDEELGDQLQCYQCQFKATCLAELQLHIQIAH